MIMLSKCDIPFHFDLLFAFVDFWNIAINGFFFPLGMMSHTLFHVTASLGLPIHGDEVCSLYNMMFVNLGVKFSKSSASYSNFLSANNKGKSASSVLAL